MAPTSTSTPTLTSTTPASTATTSPPSASPSSDTASSIKPTVAAGLGIAAAAVLAIIIWIAVLWNRRRQRARRKKRTLRIGRPQAVSKSRDDTFAYPQLGSLYPNASHSTLDLPVKEQASNLTQEDIFEHHASNGTLPRPFAPIPGATSHIESSSPPVSRPPSLLPPTRPSLLAHGRTGSSASWISFPGFRNSARQSASALSSIRGSTMSASSNKAFESHKIRQIFTPILPDELHLVLGERVTLIRQYDDGWTIVARDTPNGGDTEMGAIPAWCLLKPMKGVSSERPIRSASIGVTVTFDEPRHSGRSDILSWSNF